MIHDRIHIVEKKNAIPTSRDGIEVPEPPEKEAQIRSSDK